MATPAPPMMGCKPPKSVLLAIIKAGVAKSEMSGLNTIIMGFMAGAFIGLGGLLTVIVAGGSNAAGAAVIGPGLTRFIGGAVFPIGLILVALTGAELFTGNVMYMSVALLAGKISCSSWVRNVLISYLSNFVGAIVVAYFFTYLCGLFAVDPWNAYILTLTDKKLTMGWGVVFVKGVGANWLVCLATYLGLCADSVEGKILGIWWPIMTFVTLGYEHSIANMFNVPAGLMYGSPHTFGGFLTRNLIPCTLGNIFAGVFLVACPYFLVHRDAPVSTYRAPRARKPFHRTHHRHHALYQHHLHSDHEIHLSRKERKKASRYTLMESPRAFTSNHGLQTSPFSSPRSHPLAPGSRSYPPPAAAHDMGSSAV
jgi:formate/nitrite transporter